MQKNKFSNMVALIAVLISGLASLDGMKKDVLAQSVGDWQIHDENRPQPPIVEPGYSYQNLPVQPPSDAFVLFAGRDLSQWQSSKGGEAAWKVENGYFEVVKKTGNIQTKQSFGDCQLHIEWAAPEKMQGKGQERGNSGVFLMGRYEVQVLDSYQNETYPDGQAAAIYGQYPPMVNACRPPGHWQTYDIIFRAPRFDESGKLISPARLTVFHNNILVHENIELTGPTEHKKRPPYKAHAEKLPIMLQDHGNPVRFRNIWVRDL